MNTFIVSSQLDKYTQPTQFFIPKSLKYDLYMIFLKTKTTLFNINVYWLYLYTLYTIYMFTESNKCNSNNNKKKKLVTSFYPKYCMFCYSSSLNNFFEKKNKNTDKMYIDNLRIVNVLVIVILCKFKSRLDVF